MQRKELQDLRAEMLNKEEILKEMRASLLPSTSQPTPDPQKVSGIESVIQEELQKTIQQARRYEAEIASRVSQSSVSTPSPAGASGRATEGATFDLLSEFHGDMK